MMKLRFLIATALLIPSAASAKCFIQMPRPMCELPAVVAKVKTFGAEVACMGGKPLSAWPQLWCEAATPAAAKTEADALANKHKHWATDLCDISKTCRVVEEK